MPECTFCRILRDGKDIMLETEFFFAQFDKYPAAPGHCTVVPKRHMVSLFDLMPEEWAGMQEAVTSAVRHIEGADLRAVYEDFITRPMNPKSDQFCRETLTHMGLEKKPDGYNIGFNEGRAAGRTIDHVHLHIIPRWEGDVVERIGGIRNVIRGKGDYSP